MNKKVQLAAALLLVVLLSGCAAKKDSIYQVSTIVELMRGKYDGNVTVKQLHKKGNFGVGTVNGLDGELLLINGKAYHLRGQVRAGIAKNFIKTPYAMVTNFKPEVEEDILNVFDYDQFIGKLDSMIDTQNLLTAVKVEGIFKNIKFRIVPAQQPPYRPLAEVMPEQREVEMQNMEGTLVGFYIPRYMAGINTPGYHFHFISKDKKIGGHVLDFTIQEGAIQLDSKNYFVLDLNNEKSIRHKQNEKIEQQVTVNIQEDKSARIQEVKQEEKIEQAPKPAIKKEEILQSTPAEMKEIKGTETEQTVQAEPEPQQENAIKSIDENNPAPVSPAMTGN